MAGHRVGMWRGAAAAFGIGVSLVSLTACGSGSSGASSSAASTTHAGATTSAGASSGGASDSAGGNAPIGGGSIDLGSGTSTTSYPPSMLSQDLATDCYNGGDRVYDRYGITCGDATRVLRAYEAAPESSSGGQKSIEKYQCSHNPPTMVNQGAAPGKCVDSGGNVVFNWRYPGAPQPA